MSLYTDIHSLEPGALIELFCLDLTPIDPNAGVLYFVPEVNELNEPVVWQGVTYAPYPAQASGFEYSGRGQMPRPKLSITTQDGLARSMNYQYNDLVGAKFVRKRTFAKYLDAINFQSGVNPSADPTVEFPQDIFYVERKVSESKHGVEYELASLLDVEGVMLPLRQVLTTCSWEYRKGDCPYRGPDVADRLDRPVTDPNYDGVDSCGKRVASCAMRFKDPAKTTEKTMSDSFGIGLVRRDGLPFGGFPGAGRLTR